MVGTMHTDYAPRARPQTAPAACFPPPHCLCLHAPRVLACGASCVRSELAPTGNTHLYSTVSLCMLDRTSEEPGPLVAAACSRRSRLPTHRMMRNWAVQSLRVLQCVVASNSPPCNRMGNVCTVAAWRRSCGRCYLPLAIFAALRPWLANHAAILLPCHACHYLPPQCVTAPEPFHTENVFDSRGRCLWGKGVPTFGCSYRVAQNPTCTVSVKLTDAEYRKSESSWWIARLRRRFRGSGTASPHFWDGFGCLQPPALAKRTKKTRQRVPTSSAHTMSVFIWARSLLPKTIAF